MAIDRPAFVHPDADVGEGPASGNSPRRLPGARIGRNRNLNATLVEGGAALADRVDLKCGVDVWSGVSAGRRRVLRAEMRPSPTRSARARAGAD